MDARTVEHAVVVIEASCAVVVLVARPVVWATLLRRESRPLG